MQKSPGLCMVFFVVFPFFTLFVLFIFSLFSFFLLLFNYLLFSSFCQIRLSVIVSQKAELRKLLGQSTQQVQNIFIVNIAGKIQIEQVLKLMVRHRS